MNEYINVVLLFTQIVNDNSMKLLLTAIKAIKQAPALRKLTCEGNNDVYGQETMTPEVLDIT